MGGKDFRVRGLWVFRVQARNARLQYIIIIAQVKPNSGFLIDKCLIFQLGIRKWKIRFHGFPKDD